MHCILPKSDAVCYIWHSKECTGNQDESMEASLILLCDEVIRGEVLSDDTDRILIPHNLLPERGLDQRSGAEPNDFPQFLSPSLLCHRHLYSEHMVF